MSNEKPELYDLYRHILFDPELVLRNVIASQALEGLVTTEDEIESCRKIIYGEISVESAIAEIHKKLAAEKIANPHLFGDPRYRRGNT